MFLLYYGAIDFFIGFIAGIKPFTAAVLGGIGSLPGRGPRTKQFLDGLKLTVQYFLNRD